MYLHRKLENPELIDLLAIHTHRLTQIMVYGESYGGEYETCRRTIELLQNEVFFRKGVCRNTTYYKGSFNQSSAIS
ncbi:MAG TPA: hypothetical protein VGQ04_20590 [Chitinophagaceae bacterium]|jgi:hypothetical protein|nr:hypothetical protein [Chitinophagaceae bacterium]